MRNINLTIYDDVLSDNDKKLAEINIDYYEKSIDKRTTDIILGDVRQALEVYFGDANADAN